MAEIWRPYLHDVANHHDPALINTANLERLLTTRTSRVLTSRNEILVRVTDVHRGLSEGDVTSTLYHTPETLEAALDSEPAVPDGLDVRVISIYSSDSIAPLKISPPLLAILLRQYAVHPAFIQVLLSFGRNVHVSEAGSSHICVDTRESDAYISYQVNYVEERPRKIMPWSWRHTGVYHHRRYPQAGQKGHDLFIILQPNEASILDTRIQDRMAALSRLSSDPGLDQERARDFPEALHSLVLSSFLYNWRWYLRHLGDQFDKYNNRALVTLPKELSSQESYDMISALRNLSDSALRAQICCRGNLELVKGLNTGVSALRGRECVDPLQQGLRGYDHLEPTLRGNIDSCAELVPRIRNAIDLAGYTLSLHTQLETARVNEELRDLTSHLKNLQQDTVDDSAAVKIITFVSAVYLPGSFVVSIYGMNFFNFDDEAREIVIAKDFWVFLATWLPLTLATGVVYVLIMWFDSWWKRKPFRLFERPEATKVETETTGEVRT
ncbi:hypothetical protein BO70DRAFT_432813 [Aspergillus heteromorphus CBS 117.55]|uniref:CorA-like transporter domain-containing protein n=1 Tax=Aspergillus heteromorphus CBS 117.55 TaxID=1448321 RepID=A0A317V321_9EURO|nr:uncharacterized protein BO70DRAFT_432813 [Aspergillus heteromorphus CBS 117.55]PWY68485.1 hypothetical protein BO70DRAFT_432813 [Aspergillus heteromorphus CBS 117.55]